MLKKIKMERNKNPLLLNRTGWAQVKAALPGGKDIGVGNILFPDGFSVTFKMPVRWELGSRTKPT